MPQFSGFLDLMDSRSFASIWFWLLLVFAWSVSGRAVLGVPGDVIAAARRAMAARAAQGTPDEPPAALALLDWLSLTLPRWRVGPGEGVGLLAAGAFVLTSLAILGFGYELEFAQALVALLAPFAVHLGLQLHLARQLAPVLAQAQTGALPPAQAAGQALRHLCVHRRWVAALSFVTYAVVALWAALYALRHPNGL